MSEVNKIEAMLLSSIYGAMLVLYESYKVGINRSRIIESSFLYLIIGTHLNSDVLCLE